MPDIDFSNLSAEECFIAFFAVSFGLLALIGLAAVPGWFRTMHKQVRLLSARSRRAGRTLADKRDLLALSSRIEGIYYFEEPTSWIEDPEPEGEFGVVADGAGTAGPQEPRIEQPECPRERVPRAPARKSSYRAEAEASIRAVEAA